ncbi:MAG: hypothetical protein J6B28_00085 [Eubacterium sp.]|nr:hypothetical protein [Eubacterium sp.]
MADSENRKKSRRIRRNLIGKTAIYEKSRELDIPVEHLFGAYVMEQLAVQLAASERGFCLLLKNPDILTLQAQRGNVRRRMYYVYVCDRSEKLEKTEFTVFLKQTIKWTTETNIVWSWRSHTENEYLYVELVAELEDMRLPVELVICTMNSELLLHPARKEQVRLVMETSKTRPVYVYPSQEQMLDNLYEIMSKLELINDMSVYENMYEVLGIQGFEGRELQKLLERFSKESGIKLDAVRYGQLEKYLSYPYMKKKWNAYVKKQRRALPAWEEVYGRFWSFLMPPWNAINKGTIYLGIWIPDLGRYLD